MKTKTKIFDNLNDLNKDFTLWLKELLSENEPLTIALSGGTTPKSLFDYWAKNHAEDIEWSKIKFFWSDERCVWPDNDDSNYKIAKDHLFDHLPISQENIFRIRGENDPYKEARSYSDLLLNEVEQVNGIPQFDIIMLGMGEDGHTASIFPHEMNLWDSSNLCVVATHPKTRQMRVSLSGRTINAAKNVAFLVTGAAKAKKVQAVIEDKEKAQEKYPAAKVQPTSGNLIWFLDSKAAKLLEKK
ncbi:MAG: 6-phosphogluconolactonase [Dysgonamonadaceae bacterium]|nr:6-phosphogluconolactonase [Dysgonamonadaceae bacterium]MDD3356028.1 6-phosphogluconolactonase [Dysgonamonadaceae bacterium]MDD3727265.1 6-phosphogluconolactonase [Dysgonamonadaceae bacterium]MDD4246093.1 6-phosphogluconolactonase [Dysgonamonadaceae bacterium]MDD4605225.1 6-phosphogluconolactonase [Dysgonamonadaceae bacterium]